MLSKLDFFAQRTKGEISRIKAETNVSDLVRLFESYGRNVGVCQSEGGTLGLLYKISESGHSRFLKTHLPSSQCRESLCKEIDILSFLYSDLIHIESLEMLEGNASTVYLVLDELTKPKFEMGIEDIGGLVAEYSIRLKNYPNSHLIPNSHNFIRLVDEGEAALESLYRIGLIRNDIKQKARIYISLLRNSMSHFSPCICHGDLGPKNIMMSGDHKIVIDWEDAFWGIEGYDYLYWLTFFNNRKFYSQKIFGKTPWGKEIDMAIMILILLIKCEISVRSKDYHSNSMSFDQRILEILVLE